MPSKILISQFDAETQSHGLELFEVNSVDIQGGASAFIITRVKDNLEYQVKVYIREERCHAECECSIYQRGKLCTHIWATLIAATQRGHLKELEALQETALILKSNTTDSTPTRSTTDDKLTPDTSKAIQLKAGEPEDRSRIPPLGPEDFFAFQMLKEFLIITKIPFPSEEKFNSEYDFHNVEVFNAPILQPHELLKIPSELVFVIDAPKSRALNSLILEINLRIQKQFDPTGQIVPRKISDLMLDWFPDELDIRLLKNLIDTPAYHLETKANFLIPSSSWQSILKGFCHSGRCLLRKDQPNETTPLQWDDGEPWQFEMTIEDNGDDTPLIIYGQFHRDDQRASAEQPDLLLLKRWIFLNGQVSALEAPHGYPWILLLRTTGPISIPPKDRAAFLEGLHDYSDMPPLRFTGSNAWQETSPRMRPFLRILEPSKTDARKAPQLRGELFFQYEDTEIDHEKTGNAILLLKERRLIRRDFTAEKQAVDRLLELGFCEHAFPNYQEVEDPLMELNPKALLPLTSALLEEDWKLEAKGKLHRTPKAFKTWVTSGIDWLELHGNVDFDGIIIDLPEVMKAIRSGARVIALSDGTTGMIPISWLKKFGMLTQLGEPQDGHFRFQYGQASILDVLLMELPETDRDKSFEEATKRIQAFEGLQPAEQPETFIGKMRAYQREGLSWLRYLQEMHFGGCLADDMGLGKTIQALALLEERRLGTIAQRNVPSSPKTNNTKPAEKHPPSLIVVPRSLMHTWREQAECFTPGLNVMLHDGADRDPKGVTFPEYDVILTTYGLLLRDIDTLKDIHFDYAILDEAQAIKNPASNTAKAARLLKANHRLALTGTPVENRLSDLWSIMEFLNPGLLGSLPAFAGLNSTKSNMLTGASLSRIMRPFLLRRTKEQVAKDLPQKTEQTLHCEMKTKQRTYYDQLREGFRAELLGRIEQDGLNKSKLHILEVLLRLRQAACHPGLVDKNRAEDPSAKLETLVEMLREILAEGHKALVFSQFTSLLALVKSRLDHEKMSYEYLDGQTRNRQEKVDHFQTNKNCPIFLISLKAGGTGLNLTAASYVFILDPWWNPAVEAQAIDRTHRIGQNKPVFAYRLISTDTIEGKIMDMQATKKALADSIFGDEKGFAASLSKEDLEQLLT